MSISFSPSSFTRLTLRTLDRLPLYSLPQPSSWIESGISQVLTLLNMSFSRKHLYPRNLTLPETFRHTNRWFKMVVNGKHVQDISPGPSNPLREPTFLYRSAVSELLAKSDKLGLME